MKKIIFLLALCTSQLLLAQTAPKLSVSRMPGVNGEVQKQLNLVQPYKKYVTRITQSSTSAPVDTTLEYNFDHLFSWRYVSAGTYNIRCTGCFSTTNTTVIPGAATTVNTIIKYSIYNADSMQIVVDSAGVAVNGKLTNWWGEFRTYPQ